MNATPAGHNAAARSGFRKTLLWLHTWTGLTIGLAMVFLAVTGGVLVMRPNFDDVVNGRLLRTPACSAPLALDVLAAKAVATHRGKLAGIELSDDPQSSVAATFSNKDYVYLDACTGAVLGVQNQYGGLFGVMDALHRFRFVANGRATGGALSATAMILLVIGGVILWWPRRGSSLKSALSFNIRLPGMARTLSLHKFLGLYASAFLLVMTVTALPLSFGWAREAISTLTHSSVDTPRPPQSISRSRGTPRITMQGVWSRVKVLVPTVKWASLGYPKKGVITVEYLDRGAPHSEAKSYLYIDAGNGRTLSQRPYATDIPLGRKVYLFILALHRGLVGGFPYQLALMLACFAVPVEAYSGFSPYIRKQLRKSADAGVPLKLVDKWIEAKDVCVFEFVHAKGRPLPAFSAGSHIDLQIEPDLVRQFSLCNDPKETHRYMIAVLRRADSRGGSVAMHDQIQVGHVLQASAPRNHFPLAHGAEHSLLIAGGIGITPLLCMADRLSNSNADFVLHYCVHSMDRAAFAGRLNGSAFSERVRFHVTQDGDRLDVGALLRGADRQTHIYACGPASLIDDVVGQARELGWPDDRVHREYFVAEAHDVANDKSFDVKVASTGQIVHIAHDQSVVRALARHGIDIPTSCSEGVCGTCLTRVLAGEVDHRDRVQTPGERAANTQFTPCCSRSIGPVLVLDL